MSYDVYISPPKIFVCHVCQTEHDIKDFKIQSEHFNCTYNLADLFFDYLDFDPYKDEWGLQQRTPEQSRGIKGLNGLKGWQVYKIISKSLKNLLKDRGTLDTHIKLPFDEKYNASNGYGTVQGAIQFLNGINRASRMHPNTDVTVC